MGFGIQWAGSRKVQVALGSFGSQLRAGCTRFWLGEKSDKSSSEVDARGPTGLSATKECSGVDGGASDEYWTHICRLAGWGRLLNDQKFVSMSLLGVQDRTLVGEMEEGPGG
jgi:hypothetical protein